MRTAKKIIALMLCALLLLPFASCKVNEEEGISVVCTLFPFYDLVREVARGVDGVNIKLLVSDGSDAHSYQPSFDDVIALKEADLTVRIGGYGDGFVDEAIKGGDGVDLRLSEVDGVTVRHIANESHEHTDECDDHGHGSEDEHIWLSLKNAVAFVGAIARELSRIDPANAEKYEANAAEYSARLLALDARYASAVGSAENKRLVFADRFPFVYMTEDYGIEYAAAFSGCTTEADASFDTVFRLAERIDEWGLSCVCVTESYDEELVRTVVGLTAAKNAGTVEFDSMQSVSSADIDGGITYISVMEKNLRALKLALGVGD